MELRAVELRLVELHLVADLATGIGTHGRRPVVLVRVETAGEPGLGECSALAEPTYTYEYARGAFAVLGEHLVPRLLDGAATVAHTEEALGRLAAVRGHEMARAGLEMALLDAELKGASRSLAECLGAVRDEVIAGATIGLGSVEEVLGAVGAARDGGYRQVKVKIVPGSAATVLAAVRRAHPDLVLCADANGTFDPSADRPELERIAGLGLTALEQPFAAEELEASGQLVERGIPVVLDESVVTLADLERALVARAAVGVALKPARVGGLLVARELARRCAEAGLSCGLGGMLETGVGRAAALCLAGRPEFDLPCDLGGSERYFVPDLTAPHVVRDGMLHLPTGPGLGIVLDDSLVEEATVATTRLAMK